MLYKHVLVCKLGHWGPYQFHFPQPSNPLRATCLNSGKAKYSHGNLLTPKVSNYQTKRSWDEHQVTHHSNRTSTKDESLSPLILVIVRYTFIPQGDQNGFWFWQMKV